MAIFFLLTIQRDHLGWLKNRWIEEKEIDKENKDQSALLKTIRNVSKVSRWVPPILEVGVTQQVEGLAKCGQLRSLTNTLSLGWESTTTAGTQQGTLKESGATPLTQIGDGSIVLFQSVLHPS